MIKSILISSMLMIGVITSSFGQKKITKFCEVTASETGFSAGKFRVVLVLGKADSIPSVRGTKFETALNKVTTMKTIPDLLDYTYSLGWSLVGETAVGSVNHFYFKKEFDESELEVH